MSERGEGAPRAGARHPRMDRERRTVEAMVGLYCRRRHQTRRGLCAECRDLLDYARSRLAACPFQERKTVCARCPVHCYRPGMRAKMRGVMAFAGPRMLLRHPILALHHLLDDRRKEPRGDGGPGRGGRASPRV